jgi:hypothetical protein
LGHYIGYAHMDDEPCDTIKKDRPQDREIPYPHLVLL